MIIFKENHLEDRKRLKELGKKEKMAKFIGLHRLPGFIRKMLEMAPQDASRTQISSFW